jgi:hypothetical protein
MKAHQLVLEKSTNTHVLESEAEILGTEIENSITKVKTQGETVLLHGEHGTLNIESRNFVKYVQQEFNPVTRIMQNSFD